jgi:transposase-like protein
MPLQGHGRSALEMTNGRPLCTQCRVPMWAVYTGKGERDDQRSFECPRCGHAYNDRRISIKLSACVR